MGPNYGQESSKMLMLSCPWKEHEVMRTSSSALLALRRSRTPPLDGWSWNNLELPVGTCWPVPQLPIDYINILALGPQHKPVFGFVNYFGPHQVAHFVRSFVVITRRARMGHFFGATWSVAVRFRNCCAHHRPLRSSLGMKSWVPTKENQNRLMCVSFKNKRLKQGAYILIVLELMPCVQVQHMDCYYQLYISITKSKKHATN